MARPQPHPDLIPDDSPPARTGIGSTTRPTGSSCSCRCSWSRSWRWGRRTVSGATRSSSRSTTASWSGRSPSGTSAARARASGHGPSPDGARSSTSRLLPLSGLRSSRVAIESWIAGHLALQISIVSAAIGVSKYVQLAPGSHIPAEDIEGVAIPFTVFYLALILIGLCSRRRPQGPLNVLRGGTALLIVVTALVTWRVDAVNVIDGVIAMTAIALVHAAVAGRLREPTIVTRARPPVATGG